MTNNSQPDEKFFTIDHAEIIIDEESWQPTKNIAEIMASVTKELLKEPQEISILLTNDSHIRNLNLDFRGQDKPTNVLSFPSDEEFYLGDIAISYNTLAREAEEQDKDFLHHFIHMLIHGILHLLGYDHETDDEALEMEAKEIKILEDRGIKNPYI